MGSCDVFVCCGHCRGESAFCVGIKSVILLFPSCSTAPQGVARQAGPWPESHGLTCPVGLGFSCRVLTGPWSLAAGHPCGRWRPSGSYHTWLSGSDGSL